MDYKGCLYIWFCPYLKSSAPVQVKNSLLYNVLLSCLQSAHTFLFMVPKLPVTHLRVAVPIKIELRLFRSKTVCSYNVLLSCLQSAHTFVADIFFFNVMVPKLPVIQLRVAVLMKIELSLFRSKKFPLIMFFSPVPKLQTDRHSC